MAQTQGMKGVKNIAENFFRHCDKQTNEPVKGKITGKIPEWLEGTLIRNGTGIFKVGNEEYKHAFDGLAILHHYKISNGEATYFNRALESDAYKKNMASQRICVGEFGTYAHADPCASLFDRFKMTFSNFRGRSENMMTDNCCVNVGYYGDQLYAMTETCFLRRINADDLKPVGGKTFISDYVAMNSATAHPHVLPDGSVINVGNNWRHKNGPHYCFMKVPPASNSEGSAFDNAKLIGEIPARWRFNPTYFHSFGMTTDKLIFVESPLCMSVPKIATCHLTEKSYRECLTWHPNQTTRLHVMSMTGERVPIVYEVDPFFTFHHVNAFEKDGHVIVDICAYENADVIESLSAASTELVGQALDGASVRRFVLPLDITGKKPGDKLITLPDCKATAYITSDNVVKCKPEMLTNFWVELPRINYKYNGLPYDYMYGACSKGKVITSENSADLSQDTIIKINVSKPEETWEWTAPNGVVNEPIFVANPSAQNGDEDDGIVLTAVQHNTEQEKVTLYILNAKNLEQMASAEFTGEGRISSTFHGIWANKQDDIHVY